MMEHSTFYGGIALATLVALGIFFEVGRFIRGMTCFFFRFSLILKMCIPLNVHTRIQLVETLVDRW